jgi:hypothetical protein
VTLPLLSFCCSAVDPYAAILLGGCPAVNSFQPARLRGVIESRPTDSFQRHNHARPRPE